jgi:hypothetical protein
LGCIIPPLPDKSLKDKIVKDDSDFVDERKFDLLRFLRKVSKHRVLSQSSEFREFVRDPKYYHSERN